MNIKNIRPASLLLISVMLFQFSCIEHMSEDDLQREEKLKIQNYLQSHDTLHFQSKESGLYYRDITAGSGISPLEHDTAFVYYSMKFFSGTVIESNLGTKDTLKFPVGEGFVIHGFDEGVTYMKKGGEAELILPSDLAYGAYGESGIGPYTPLLLNIKLVKVKKATY